MNKTDEALKLALEALELNNLEWKALADSGDCGYWNAEDQDHYKQTNEAITAIKQARSAPAQDRSMLECSINPRPLSHPLRDYHTAMSEGPLHYTWTDKPHRLVYDLIAAVKFYADRAAPVQEPVGEVNRYGLDSHGRKWHGIHWYDPNVDVAHGTKLYTTPPAQPATEESSATQPAVPDAIIEAGESPEFRDGWNECRETMLQMLKARKA
jgi:hypothetical protein